MAITRAQQAKQMLQDGGRIGLRFGSEGYQGGATNQGGAGKGTSVERGGGRDPMKQFDDPNTKAAAQAELARREKKIGLGDKTGLSSLPSLFGLGLNLFKVPTGNQFAAGFNRSLRDLNRVDPGPDRDGRGGDTPLWAQLGFNSEAEYLTALAAQGASTEEPEPEKEEEGLRLAFRAEGGPIGGEYDFETARQAYGLGKLVKKIGRSVKKIVKSPIGKAALLGIGAFGLPGGAFGMKGFLPQAFKTEASKFLFGLPGGSKLVPSTKGIFGVGGKLALGEGKLGIGSLIGGASLISGLLTPEQEEEAQQLADGTGFSIEEARNSILARARDDYKMDFRARGFRAEGGPAEGKEPVAKKTMPLLDMGGEEMDLRAEGGFVPIGRMEKADDVPARLSKNEFVFTADAVRNAGDGDVDKGAEVMYNMMKNLESGGDVSEESQGLEGARKMFQTSQRLEEVL